jgi:hypothetical protein
VKGGCAPCSCAGPRLLLPDALLDAGGGRVHTEEGRREGLFERRLDGGPHILRIEGLEAREAGEDVVEAVVGLVPGVGLDGHEDREPIERAHDGLGCGRGLLPQRRNKEVHAAFVFAWVRVVQLEEVMECARVLVCAVTRGVDGEPVGERGHGEGGDGEDVDEALVAPRDLLEQ